MPTGESEAKGEVTIGKKVRIDYPIHIDLPDGGRMLAIYPNASSEQEVIDRVLEEYEAAAPIVALATETAHHLGVTAKQLLEMAINRIENAEDNERRSQL